MSINIGDGVLRLIADPTGVDRELGQMGRKGARAGKQVTAGLKPVSASLSNIKKLVLGVTAAFVAWQAVRIIRDATKAALEFGKQFANVATIINTQTPKGVKQLQILKQQILALRPELGSATDLTKGLYQALSAGVEPAQAVKLVGEAALFAKAALTDTLTAVDVMTTVMNAYGLSADKAASISSVLFKTIEEGKITGEQLSSSLGRVISTAAQLNIDLPELNAAIATMTKTGVPAAEAMTTMSAILRTFTSPEATKRFDELGISQAKLRDIIAKDGLNAALEELDKRLKGDTAATTNLFRESEAQKGIFILLGKGADEYKRTLGVLKKAQEEATATSIAAAKVFATMKARLETISVTVSKELTIAFMNLEPAINAVLTSLGATGASGENLRIILNAVAFSITFLTQVLLLGKGVVEAFLLGLERMNLAWLEFQQRLLGATARFTNLNRRVREARNVVDDLSNAMQTDLEQIGKLEAKLAELGQDLELVADEGPRAASALDEIGAAAGRVGPSFDLAAAGVARFRGENAALIEQFEQARFKQSLEELNQGLGEIPLNLELATEGIGAFVEPTEEQLEAMRKRLEETGISFTDLGQQATDAFNQIAGAVQGSGGVMLRILGLIVGQIFRNIAANQAIAASTVATEAAKKGATIKAIKDIALVRTIFETAAGFSALARLDFFAAAKHFAAAGFFGAVGALQIAAVAGAFGGGRGGGGAPGAGAEGAAPVRGQVAGDTSGGGTLEVERRLQEGGIITRPTLALLGEQAPRIPEVVIPLRRNRAGGIELDEGGGVTIVQHFHIEGVISADVLEDVIEQINKYVRDNDGHLQASDSFNVTSK
jgi:TP901 family phage tail tape measure protein